MEIRGLNHDSNVYLHPAGLTGAIKATLLSMVAAMCVKGDLN